MFESFDFGDAIGAIAGGVATGWAYLAKNTEGWTKRQWAIAAGVGVLVAFGLVVLIGS